MCAASLAAAQGGTGVIRGRTSDVGGGAIVGVQISVTGTTLRAVTSASGDYVVNNVPAGSHQIMARRVGYARSVTTVNVSTGGDTRVDFRLTPAASQLDEVVITGTAGGAERRTIGNSLTQLDVADLTDKSDMKNVTELLQAKTPGITISPGSGTPGTASDIVLRGYSSFTANRPVVYIDGVRMNTDSLYNFTPSGSGASPFTGQRTSALDLINPDDIESIEVIKGPAAGTLYGADAAAGVIQIITKKGQRGQQRNRWNVRAETGQNEWGANALVNYVTCTPTLKAQKDAAGNFLWNGYNGGPQSCLTVPDNAILTDEPFKRDPAAMRDGGSKKVSVSLRGGAERYSYYVSGENTQDEGIMLNSSVSTRTLRTNFAFTPTDVTDVGINVGYIRNNLALPLGDEAGNGLLLSAARGKPGRTVTVPQQYGWATSYPDQANHYNNRTKTDRFTVTTTMNYNPLSWLRSRAILGLDLTTGEAQVLSLPGDIDVPLGFVAQRVPRDYNYTMDLSSSAVRSLGHTLESTTSVGGQVTSHKLSLLTASGTQLPPGGIETIGSAITISGSNTFSEYNQVGEYVQEQLAWRNRVYLTAALRGDAHSSFGKNADYITFPKASLSWVLSDEPSLQGLFRGIRSDNFRFRTAWGQAGRAPQPYAADPTYTADRVAVGTSIQSALRTSSFGNPNLKPERGTEIEVGVDADFFSKRLGLEATHYDKTMRDLLVPLAIPPSLGFAGSILTNIGQTRNLGNELSVTVTPIQTSRIVWDARVNGSWNRNRLVTLDPNRQEELLSGLSYTPGMQRNRVGFPLGAFMVQLPVKDASGNYLFSNAGRTSLLLQTDTAVVNGVAAITPHITYIGSPVPTQQYSLSNTFTVFKNWRVYALFDHQGGFTQMNYKEYNRCAVQSPANCWRENDPSGDTTMKRVYAATNSQPLYLEKGDFVKLRDLSLTYTLPSVVSQRVGADAALFTLAAHNLKIWTNYDGLDPEVNEYSNATNRGNSPLGRADAYSMPQLKRISFTLNLTY